MLQLPDNIKLDKVMGPASLQAKELSPLRSLRMCTCVRKEVDLVPLACKNVGPGVRFGGAGGVQGVKKNFFFKHCHVAYQIDGDEEKNRMQLKFSS